MESNDQLTLKIADLLSLWSRRSQSSAREKDPLLPRLAKMEVPSELRDFEFPVSPLSEDEVRDQVVDMLRTIEAAEFDQAGSHKIEKWIDGWGENLREALDGSFNSSSLLPKYFRPDSLQRFDGWLYRTRGEGFEPTFLAFLVDLVVAFELETSLTHAKGVPIVAEFGCGTGHHLIRLAKKGLAARCHLLGLDWASPSQVILREWSKQNPKLTVRGFHFDYFDPNLPQEWANDASLSDSSDGGVFFTVASLEQVGSSHERFIDFCLEMRPRVVIHFEPIAELLGTDSLSEVSREYFAKRNYLHGFLDALETRDAEGQLRLISAERVGFGSRFTEGYSLVRWSPNPN